MNITLYTIHCPRCNVLKSKLDAQHIQYQEITDENIMQALGLDDMPILEVNGERYDFSQAIQWLKTQEAL